MFKLSFKTDNAAFQENGEHYECARILRALADKLENGIHEGIASDLNGNKVGGYKLS
jgi:hypothetical protein